MTSGRSRTKAEVRAAGLRRLEVVLDAETWKRLELVALDYPSRADAIRAMIDREWWELEARIRM